MRDKNAFSIARALPRMSWSLKNFFLLHHRTVGERSAELNWRQTNKTLFQQRWMAKTMVRAYHGDYIPEKVFKRWYLPETLPDVRPKRAVLAGDDKASLEDFAKRNHKEIEWHEEEKNNGMAPVGSLMFMEVERRIDTVVFRCCFAHSIYEARRLVIHGYVKLNGKQHCTPGTRLAPGDMISVDPKAIKFLKMKMKVSRYDNMTADAPKPDKLTSFWLPNYASPWLFIPAYIEPNFNTCSAIYVRHPTARPGYSEIPTPYDADGDVVRAAWEWYVKRKVRIRSNSQIARMPLDRAFTPTTALDEKETLRRKRAAARRIENTRGMILK